MSAELHSLRGLAWILGVPLERLVALARTADHQYRPFTKKRPGKSPRPIDNPRDDIKEVQRLARRRFLANQPIDDSVRACVKGGSPYKNAKVHCNQKNLARVDVKKCYPSITNTMAYRLLRTIGLGPKPASLLTRLATRKGHLPQGAPTSDMIANLYLSPIDRRAKEIAGALDLENSRCLDDVAVSGDGRTREAIGPLIEAIRGLGLAVRHGKTGNAGATKVHVLTGYHVNGPHGPKVAREKVQEIRTAVYQLVWAHRCGEPIEERSRSVRGSLAYLRPTKPGLVLRLERQLDAAGVPFRTAGSQVGRQRPAGPRSR